MLQYFFKNVRDEKFQSLPSIKEGCWIHIDEAQPHDLNELAQYLGLEQSDLLDSLDKFEMPRIEKIDATVLIFTRYPFELEAGLYTSTLTIILSPHYLTTVCPNKSPLIGSFLNQKSKLSTLQRSKLLISILLKTTHEFTVHIRRVRQNVLKQEKEMITVASDDITELTKNEEILNQYMSALVPLSNVLETITLGRYTNIYEKDQDLIEDLLNTVKQSESLCDISLKSIRSLRDSYQIIFTNNLNKVIRLLAALTILFNIPTMIFSFYGMNVDLPFSKHTFAFLYIIVATGIAIIFTVLYFQRKKWI